MTMLKCRYCQTVFSGNNCPACNCPAEHAEAVPPPDAVDLLVDCPDCGLAFSRLRKDGCPQCGCPTKYAIDPSLPAEPAAPAPSPSPLPSSVEPAPERKSAVSSSSSGVECPDCGITFDRQQSACPRCGCPAQYAIEDVPPEQEPKRNVAASGMRVGSPLSYNSAPVNAPAPRRTALYIIIAVAALLGIIPLNDLLQPLHRSYIRQKLYIRQHASSRLNPMLKANEKEFLVDYGDNFRMRFVRIPEGSFLMGSPESEYGRGWDEDQHQVTISKPFYMGAYEVTQAQYRSMVGENPSSFRGDDNPVEQVSWDDAMDFCWIASFKTGLDVRLPTEAEWEYACRAGTTTPFNTNGRSIANQENYNATATYYRNEQKGVRRGATIAVGSFSANAWGLYDMHGNVTEWCSDRWGSYPKEDVTDPKGPESGSYHRMLRGGAWWSNPKSCRSASRFYRDPSVSANDTGFRVCLASTVEFFSDPSVSSPATAPAPKPAPAPTAAAANGARIQETAEEKNPDEQVKIGHRYYNSKDYEQSVVWYRKAAEQGHARAQYDLGYAYAYGQGVPEDRKQGVAWFRKSAEQGNAGAQYSLGYAYDHGRGVPQDHEQAVAWYRKAADQGYANAQNNLGYAYAYGRGVPQDHEQAVAWYRKSAEQGNAAAQSNLGSAYEHGRGVPQDSEQSVAWYQKAAEQGNDYAKKRLTYFNERTADDAPAAAKRITLDCGNGVQMELTQIQPGTFMMGSPGGGDEEAYVRARKRAWQENLWGEYDETQHSVTISKPFYMGIYEVTQAQYEAVMGKNPSQFSGSALPVEKVTYPDAIQFCVKLSYQTGRTVRLPTEAEWEYACRAGTTTPFNTGNVIGTEQANYDGTYVFARSAKGVRRGKTTAVGSFAPNAWGLHDMHGNVWEWCSDIYGKFPKENLTDPKGAGSGPGPVCRGGDWKSSPSNIRSAVREWDGGVTFAFDLYPGFRVCVE